MSMEQTEQVETTVEEQEAPPGYVTQDYFESVLEQQKTDFENRFRGLQSRLDRDRDVYMKREQLTAAKSQLTKMESQYDNLDDSMKPFVQTQIETVRGQIRAYERSIEDDPEPEDQPVQTEQPQGDVMDSIEVSTYLSSMGLTRADIPQSAQAEFRKGNVQAFYKAGADAYVKKSIPLTETPTQNTVLPPSGGVPSGQVAFRSADDVRRAYVAGHLTLDDANRELQSRGWL